MKGVKSPIKGMSPEKEYLSWRHSPSVGCLFARVMARNLERYDQRIARISSAGTPENTAARIARVISEMMADKAAAAVLLFPELSCLETTARIMLALDAEGEWHVKSVPVPPPPKAFVALNITRTIPFGKRTCPSEALVLGPFNDEVPPTRRAPVTALEIYIGEPRPRGPLNDKPTEKANLAHIEMQLPSHDAFVNTWNKSKEGRTRELGGKEDNRAKAKASLVIPETLANRLGCAP